MSDKKETTKSSVYGTIAIVIAVIIFFTPKLFLSMALIGLAIFTILGLIMDGSKIPALIALVIGGFILYVEVSYEMKSLENYSVEYQVECTRCEVSYTNTTGGLNKVEDVRGNWSMKLEFKGGEFINVSAQNEGVSDEVTARILVNGRLLKEESSQGKYQIASVYGTPQSIDTN